MRKAGRRGKDEGEGKEEDDSDSKSERQASQAHDPLPSAGPGPLLLSYGARLKRVRRGSEVLNFPRLEGNWEAWRGVRLRSPLGRFAALCQPGSAFLLVVTLARLVAAAAAGGGAWR